MADLTQDQVLKNLSSFGYKTPQASQIGGAQVQDVGITQNGTTPITSDLLVPSSSYKLPPRSTPTAATGVGEAALTHATQIQSNVDKQISDNQAKLDAQASDISSMLSDIGGQDARKLQAKQDNGLVAQKQQVDALTADIKANNDKATLKIQQLVQQNPTGMVGSGAQGEVDRIKREAAFYAADKSIELATLSGQYDRAKEAIDAKIDVRTEQMKADLEAKKFIYDNNKDTFTKAENRAYQAQITKDQRDNETEKNKLQDIGKVQLEAAKNGASADVIKQIGLAGDYSSALIIAANKGVLTTASITGSSIYQPIDASTVKDKNAGNKDWGGLSYNALYNDAKNYLATGGKLPSIGLSAKGDVAKAKNAIQNYAGQIADAMGMDITQISALYKANAKAASDIIGRVARIETVSNTLTAQFPRIAELANKVKALGITESDIQAGAAKAKSKFGSVDAANYIELIQTVRGDYAAMQSALAGSRGGQQFVLNAEEAIPLGLSSDQYLGIKETIQTSANLALQATGEEANSLITNPNGIISGGTSGGVLKSPDGKQQVSVSDLTPVQIQEAKAAGWI